MSDRLLTTDLVGSVLTVTLNDDARRNALGTQLIAELLVACDAADSDPSVRVVVVTNAGRVFCSGARLDEASKGQSTPVGPADGVPDPVELFGRFSRSPKPYVGRIAGHCLAGGMGLAAALDVTIAADDSMFGFTEVRIGVAPAVISVVCLPKLRPVDARSAFLRGHRFPAGEAARMGLITAAVPRDQLDAEVDSVVGDLLAGAPGAIAASKELLRRVPGMDSEAAFSWTRALSSELFAGAEAAEGIGAFLQKRPPAWAPALDGPG